jgi:hypothetical protein
MKRQFYSASAKGGAALFVSAALVFLLILLLAAVRGDLLPAQAWVLWLLLTMLAMYVGLMKLHAPVVLVEATAQGVRYFHPRGSYFIPWHALSLVQQVELEGKPLAYIGFRLNNYDEVLPHIPLRLAVRLMTEQRGLLAAAVGTNCPDGRCAADYIMDISNFNSGQREYRGVQAMFGQRMRHFRQFLQAELLIPADLAGCSVDEFCLFLNRQRLIFTQENNG